MCQAPQLDYISHVAPRPGDFHMIHCCGSARGETVVHHEDVIHPGILVHWGEWSQLYLIYAKQTSVSHHLQLFIIYIESQMLLPETGSKSSGKKIGSTYCCTKGGQASILLKMHFCRFPLYLCSMYFLWWIVTPPCYGPNPIKFLSMWLTLSMQIFLLQSIGLLLCWKFMSFFRLGLLTMKQILFQFLFWKATGRYFQNCLIL